MAWIAAIIGAVGSGIASNNSKKGNKKGSKGQLAAQQKAYEDAQKGLGPYAGLGPEAVNRLGALMGMEGYRTPSDIALREHLSAKPGGAGQLSEKDYQKDFTEKGWFTKPLEFAGRYEELGDPVLAKAYGFANKKSKKRKKGREAEAAAANAASAAELAKQTIAWEAKKTELEKQRDIELQSYSPTAQLEKTPGYQYRYNTGLTTAKNSLAKMNMRQSGREQKELTQYGQEFGSGEFQNEFNRLTGLASGGQNAATTLANFSIGQGSALSNIYGQQARDNSQYYGNLNEGLQGSLSNYGTARERNKRSSSYDNYPRSNSDADTYNPDYLE